jgi:hypothetical protein
MRRRAALPSSIAGLAQGAKFSADGEEFAIDYHGGNGNDVVLTALGHATVHALHHAAAASDADLWFA